MMIASISITSAAVTSIKDQGSLSRSCSSSPDLNPGSSSSSSSSSRLGGLSRSCSSDNFPARARLQRLYSLSSKDLGERSEFRRSSSYNNLCYTTNCIQASTAQSKLKKNAPQGIFHFHFPGSLDDIPNYFRSFLVDPLTKNGVDVVLEENRGEREQRKDEMDDKEELKRANWVERVIELQSRWRQKQQKDDDQLGHGAQVGNEDLDFDECGAENGCEALYGDDGAREEDVIDGALAFSRLLSPVSWSDTKLFSKLAFLSNMAYVIPEIKAEDLRTHYGLDLVTSSVAKKAEAPAIKEKLDCDSTTLPILEIAASMRSHEGKMEHSGQKNLPAQPFVAYEIAASAASYVQSCTKDLSSPSSEPGQVEINRAFLEAGVKHQDQEEETPLRKYKSGMASYLATSAMTAMVAADEKQKQEAARDLQSLQNSPCDWFICDDPVTYTRCFVIQGSDSLASWQANLFFEPTRFEGTDALVHRGIYEAAKGIYEQFLPEINQHLERFGSRAKLQFAGHSLGGSLSLLVNLMLLTKKVVEPSALLPVVTFGSPFVFCGGEKVLKELNLDENHVHCVIMHRDIVPRVFSCIYPNHVAEVLRRLNDTFPSHPCLNKNKMLYSPMGKMFILQPDEYSSPRHPFLPPGCGLYALENIHCATTASAFKAFLNNPHPLETLSDLTAYGSEGTILRDHDSSNYLKALNKVIREQKSQVRKVREQRNQLWPLLTSQAPHAWSCDRNSKKMMGV